MEELEIYGDGANGNEHKFLVVVSGGVVDRGIGAYEYFGFRGNDKQLSLEVEIEEVYLVRGSRQRKIRNPEKLSCYNVLCEKAYKQLKDAA
ncbi:MAG: hypothetical protein WCI51_07165 [Lentisphaerota bacterium]